MSKTVLSYSVREFASPNIRSGHIDQFSGFNADLTEGSEIHSIIQSRDMKTIDSYQREYSVSGNVSYKNIVVELSGRMDAMYPAKNAGIVIEEIKSTSSIDKLTKSLKNNSEHPYLLQVQCYAYLYLKTLEEQQPRITCRLRIVSKLSRDEFLIDFAYDNLAFSKWVKLRCEYIHTTHLKMITEIQRKKALSKELVFPFPSFRNGQKDLLAAVEKTVSQKNLALIQAPTGLGKTAAVMFPSFVDALSRGKKLIYVTPKNSQHRLAQEFLNKLRESGHNGFQATQIRAKAKLCLKEEPLCTPEHCEFARNYYDKLHEHQVIDKLRKIPSLDSDVFIDLGKRFEVCPFELSLDSIGEADAVVCDYNYIFSPRSRLEALLRDASDQSCKHNLVIDEAHNLPQRLSDYLSPELASESLIKLKEEEERIPEKLRAKWKRLLSSSIRTIMVHEPSGNNPREQITLDHDRFFLVDSKITSFALEYFQLVESVAAKDPVFRLLRTWSEFCFALIESNSESYTTFRRDTPSPSIKITCCDGSTMAREILHHFSSVIAFSATLKPFKYFADLCGFPIDQTKQFEFQSPFKKDHRKILVIPQVSTRMRDRERSFQRIADIISRVTERRMGNYFVFFPSFEYLRKVSECLHVDGFRILKQEPYMKQEDAQQIIDTLAEQSRRVIVLGVQGGIFSEGVDYPGDILIGAFIVGPGLPPFELERELQRNFFDKKFGNGFQYAYVNPGMTRVIQAAGRVIRSETDRGIIILIDDRFLNPQYYLLMPSHWLEGETGVEALVSSKILADIDKFWEQSNAP